jgi:hypothetical protein
MAWQLKEHIIKRKQKLANSWSFWDIMWSWAPWVLPLAGSLFMLLLAFLFGPCILHALSKFICQQVQKIKFQLLVKEYSPLPTHDPSVQFYQSLLETTQVNPWDESPCTSPPPSTPLSAGSSQMRHRPISPTAVGCSSQRGACWVWGIRRQNEPVISSPMRTLWALHPVKGQAVSQDITPWGCYKMPQDQ